MKHFIFSIALALSFFAVGNAQSLTDIRKVDFTNYTHVIGNDTVKFNDGLQDGACEEKDGDGTATGDIWNLQKDSIVYGDLDGDGKDEAFMALVANVCTGNMITDEAILAYKLERGKLVKLPEFDYFDEGCEAGKPGCNFARNPGVGAAYDAKTKSLVVETFFATADDAVCCPSLRRETWYKWNGTKFEELKKSKIEAVKNEEN